MTLFSCKPAIPDGDHRRREDKSRERMFLEHYSWLRECALNITHGERERAEDLVHDAFLQFLDKDADIAHVADIRGYLNGILRNLHLLQLRRATRRPVQQFSLMDHDSASVGLRVWSSADQLLSADSLMRACDFACYRKESSLAASILILRYFHGYFPGEICTLLGARRKLVYRWIDRGRNETKEYMESPFPLPGCGSEWRAVPSAASPQAFLRRIRERIFTSCVTDCEVLSDAWKEFGVKELAHLVSCRICLDRRSRKAGLGYVSDRHTDDISNNDDGRPQSGSGGTREIMPLRTGRKSSQRAVLREVYARRRERFEHRPKEITLAFDGQPRATLLINAPTNTLHLSLDTKEVPDSIAVLSEQEFQFLILDRAELVCSERKEYRLSLSDDRLLQVSVIPETLGSSIQLVYEDPLFSVANAEDEGSELIETIKSEEQICRFPSKSTDTALSTGSRWRDRLQNLFSAMNPLLTSAIVLGAVAAMCFVLWLCSSPTPSAGALLDHAEKSDRAGVATSRPGVIYQKVAIRTQRRTLERTIYRDAQGIRRPRRQQLAPQDEELKNKLTDAGVNWDAPLSAGDFSTWRSHLGTTRDAVTRPGPHLLSLTTTPHGNAEIVKETLIVRDTDFHAVGRTIDLRDRGTVEIAELNYDVLPWGAVNQDWFEPVAGATATDAPGILPAIKIHAPHVLSNLELGEAELEARSVLNQLHADAGERIRLTRAVQGIEIKGVVETDARMHELVARLSQLSHVQTSILSVEELGNQPQSNSPINNGQPIHVYSVEAQPSPLEQYLRERKQSLDQLTSISQNLMDGALAMQQAEVHFSELQPRFNEADQFSVNAQKQLEELSHTYLNTIDTGMDANSRTLHSLGFDDASSPRPEAVLADDLSQQVHQYQELCQEMIGGGAGQSRPAAEVARDLLSAGARIRLRVAQMAATVPRSHD